ncbi:MAG: heterodisulfide reductase-related iron-sulfur binding cluster [Zavarzinella sp.]
MTVAAEKHPLPVVAGHGPKIDYQLILDCVHCGLCTSACPTYVENGNEADSPRGRIYLMRNVIDGKLPLDNGVKQHLDLCLNCRACETACPSGVQYGKLIEPFRTYMGELEPGRQVATLSRLQRWLLFNVFPSRFRTRLALAPARLAQWTGLDWLCRTTGVYRLLPKKLRTMQAMLPPLHVHYGKLPEVLPAEGVRRARVGLFLGCVADAIYPETQLATARVLQKNGCEVVIPRSQTCCGALHYHAAYEDPAKEYAAQNLAAFGFSSDQMNDLDAVIINAAGCGAMVQDYGHLLHDTPHASAAEQFVKKAKDISQFLIDLGPVRPTRSLPIKATYHDACHLRHAQQIASAPRQLLEMIPGLELIPLPESEICCGAAGSYNLTQPQMAQQLGDRKAAKIVDTGAQAVLMGNVGCLMQVTKHLQALKPDIWVAHTIDALWAAYGGPLPRQFEQ